MYKFTFKSFFCALSLLLFAQSSHAQCVTKYDTLSPTICAGDTFYFNGVAHTATTRRPVRDTVALGSGCDSITMFTLTVLRAVRDSFSQSICTGSTLFFNGQSLTASGVYRDTLRGASVLGCDSTVIINLTVGGAVTSTAAATICRGDSFLFGGAYLKTAGAYNDTVRNGVSCDSIVVLTLAYHPTPISTITQTFCQGGGYVFNGVTLTTPGTYYDTIYGGGAQYGCDSLVRLNYQIAYARLALRDTLCYTDTLYIPGGGYILGTSGSGRYAPDTVAYSCSDTVYTYFITVDSPATPLISYTSPVLTETVVGFTSYQWQVAGTDLGTLSAQTATANGSYTVEGIDARGCSAVSAPYIVAGLGIASVADDLKTSVYPNPNAGSFVLQTYNAVGGEATVYDILGKALTQTAVSRDKMNISINAPEGIYLMKVKDSGGQVTSATFTISR